MPNVGYLPYGTVWSMKVLDLNGDGRMDAVIGDFAVPLQGGTPSLQVVTLLGKADGTFQEVFNGVSGSYQAAVVCGVGDFNRDGHPDVVVGAYATNDDAHWVHWLTITSSGGFDTDAGFGVGRAGGILFGTDRFAGGMSVGDVNNDGNLDVFAILDYRSPVTTSWGIVIGLGNGKGGFAGQIQVPGTGTAGSSPVSLGDFNADGDLDILLPNATDPTLDQTLYGNGTGTFSTTLP